MSGPACVLAEDLRQRHREPRGELRFIDRHDLDFLLRALGVSVVSLRAKQSQSPTSTGTGGDGRGRWRSRRWDRLYKQTQFTDADGDGRGPAKASAEPPLGPVAPNKPNLPCTGRERCRTAGPDAPPAPEAITPNKANASRAKRRASTLWKKSYDALDAQKTSAKQSQFPGSGQRWESSFGVPPSGGSRESCGGAGSTLPDRGTEKEVRTVNPPEGGTPNRATTDMHPPVA